MTVNEDAPTTTTDFPDINENASEATCPVVHELPQPTQGDANQQWWPHRLNLRILAKYPPATNPLGDDFDYPAASRPSIWRR